MQLDWFITTFNKLSRAISSTRKTTHQHLDSTKDFRDMTQWRPFLPKGGGLIQEEISGHPPIPLAQNKGFHLNSFSTTFQVLNFRGCFEVLKIFFWTCHSHTVGFSQSVMVKFVFLRYTY
jgi:hypothetical protein